MVKNLSAKITLDESVPECFGTFIVVVYLGTLFLLSENLIVLQT